MFQPVITRFAPSPTGSLHIGSVRTALFNWLYAKHFCGKMLLRIEDTDRKRSTKKAIYAILNGLKWLEIDWDDDVISQFSRVQRHRDIAEELVRQGKAYYCYASPEKLAQMREGAKLEGCLPRYDRSLHDRNLAEVTSGRKAAIRIKAPLDGETIIYDPVRGDIRFPNKDIDDFIILRSDGTPTYMLAVVVDDHDMGITHIIRGNDHLTNAARQKVIYSAMGWHTPVMAHIPLIHGPDGSKLSKRHGALGIEAYRVMGYLPVALRNYLVRLGWSHGNNEIMSTKEMIEWFDIKNINKSTARFDLKKLESINSHYIRSSDDDTLLDKAIAILPEVEKDIAAKPDAKHYQQFRKAMPALKKRAKTLVELIDEASFIFVQRPLPLDGKASSILDEEGRKLLASLMPMFENCSIWNTRELEITVRSHAEATGFKLVNIIQPLRAALTGRSTSPGIFDILTVLGREESIARIRDQFI